MPLRKRAGIALVALTALLLAAAAASWYAQTGAGRRTRVQRPRRLRPRRSRCPDGAWPTAWPGGSRAASSPTPRPCGPARSRASRRRGDTARSGAVFARAASDRHRALIGGDTTFAFELPGRGGPGVRGPQPRRAPDRRGDLRPTCGCRCVGSTPQLRALRRALALTDSRGWRWPLLIAHFLPPAASAALAGGSPQRAAVPGGGRGGRGLIVAGRVAGSASTWWPRPRRPRISPSERSVARFGRLWRRCSLTCSTAAAAWRHSGGAVVAALASAGIARPADLSSGVGAGRAARPARLTPSREFARGAALIALGAGLIVEPALLGRTSVVAAGGC